MAMNTILARFDYRISVVYALAATLWIIFSDSNLVTLFSGTPNMLITASMLKGVAFVGVTTLALYVVLHVELRKRIRMEDSLRESEQRFRLIADTAPVMLWTTDASGQVTFLSRDWSDFTGQTETDYVGWGWLTNLHSEDREPIREAITAAIQTRSQFQVEFRLWEQNEGEYRWVIATGTPCFSSVARFEGYVGSMIDVNGRKKAEQARQEAEWLRMELEKEKELLQLKERFISVVSHEFRTPLSVIVTSTELVCRFYERMTQERQVQHLNEVLHQAQYMTELIDEVLTVNKAQAGKLEFNPSPLNVTTFCQTTLERMQVIDKGKHSFVFVSEGGEGDLSAAALDEKLLRHILHNLLSNAVKYSPDGGEVRLEVSRQDGDVLLKVSDQGIGIPPEALEHLYDPFYRAKNTGEIGGTGLGMSIVKQSVDLHGGTISCKSQMDMGTTFWVRLPTSSSL